jgi:Ser/Thr protein kinase RdoA (MazF antagonist)
MSAIFAPSVLTMASPPVSVAEAEALACGRYGIAAKASELAGERDRNFHLQAEDGRHFMLKIVNPAEDPAVTEFQIGALRHIEARDPGLPVPRVVTTPTGEATTRFCRPGVPDQLVRLLTFLPGRPLTGFPPSPMLRDRLGRTLALIDIALAGYRHPGAPDTLMWDLTHAARLRPLLPHVEDASRRDLAQKVLDDFENSVLPALRTLRRQVIHNDFNPSNILVREDDPDTIAGIIDFGDVVEAPLINEVAVAAAYQLDERGPLLPPMAQLAAGFHGQLPLLVEEIALLFDLIRTRMAMTAIISSWRAQLAPHNRDYILRHASRAWSGLTRAEAIEPGEAGRLIRHHLAHETLP